MEKNRSERSEILNLLLAFIMPAAVFLLILLRYRIVPFGNTTLLFSDLDSQYIEFMAEYRRILTGSGSFFYSWHAGIGMNFIALTAYYLASPFNFMLVLFPENQLPLAVSLITALKLGCAGAAFAYCLRVSDPAGKRAEPLFASFYALSGWALGYAFNLMWLDALIWLPLLIAGIEQLINGKRMAAAWLTMLFALSFISHFYMAYMTGIFCVLWFLGRLFVRKTSFRECARLAVHLILCAGIAAGLSAFVLVPTFFVIKNNMGLLGQTFPAAEGAFPFFSLIRKFFPGSFDGVKDCLPHIYCGLPALLGLTMFFGQKRISGREKIAAGVLGGFLLFSFWFRPLDFLWHAMDHPSWFPYRYAFLFSFWALIYACRGFSTMDRSVIPGFIVGAVLAAAAFFTEGGEDFTFLLLNLALLAIYCAVLHLPQKPRRILFALVCLAELGISGSMVIGWFADQYTPLDRYQSFHEHYRALTEPVLPDGTDFYRMEKTAHRNYNDPLGIGFPGVSHFSSTASTRQSEFLKRLGFNCYATWCTYQGATPVTDAMLRIRYEFGTGGKVSSIHAGTDIWEHPEQFPLFFFADETFARYDFLRSGINAIERQNDLLRLLEGGDAPDYFEELPVQLIRTENLEPGKNPADFLRIDPDRNAYAEYEISLEPEKSSCLFVPGASLNYNVIVSDTDEVISARRDYTPFPVCLDAWAADSAVKVRVETTTDAFTRGVKAYALDVERLAALCETLNAAAPSIDRLSETSFRLRMAEAAEERLIVSSIPFDAGWRVSADGKRLPLKMIHESVLGFILPAGCDSVEISYRPYGWEFGLCLSGIAAVLWLAMLLWEKRHKETATI